MKVVAEIKKHPWLTAAGVFVVGLLVIYYYYYGSGSGGTVTTGGVSAGDVALAQANLAYQQHSNDVTAQLGALADKNANDYAIAKLNQTTALANIDAGKTVALGQQTVDTTNANNTLTAELAKIDAELKISESNNDTSVALANTAAAQNEYIAQQQAALQTAISNNQATVAETQVAGNVASVQAVENASVSIAKAYANAAQNSSLFGMIGGIAKAIL